MGLNEQDRYKGTIINDLVALVDHVIKGSPEAKELVRSALGVAYAKGKLDGIVEEVGRLGPTIPVVPPSTKGVVV